MRAQVLACPVRGCGQPIAGGAGEFRCPRGHTHDVARSGYVNLLQPQDSRSPAAGDSRQVVEARVRLIDAGIGRRLVEHVARHATALLASDGTAPVVVDLGCGAGHALGELAAQRVVDGIGIDLSVAAARRAATRFRQLTWVVANADRRLPVLSSSVDLVLSLYGRRNAAESARILARGGHLLMAVPAPDDLIELRTLVLGRGERRDRSEALIVEHQPHFTLIERAVVRDHLRLGPDQLRDALNVTYRGARSAVVARAAQLDALDVTVASDVLLFALR
ncbi:MAG: methyltransferase domain-containing protein [Acidobacteriota bacterium]